MPATPILWQGSRGETLYIPVIIEDAATFAALRCKKKKKNMKVVCGALMSIIMGFKTLGLVLPRCFFPKRVFETVVAQGNIVLRRGNEWIWNRNISRFEVGTNWSCPLFEEGFSHRERSRFDYNVGLARRVWEMPNQRTPLLNRGNQRWRRRRSLAGSLHANLKRVKATCTFRNLAVLEWCCSLLAQSTLTSIPLPLIRTKEYAVAW